MDIAPLHKSGQPLAPAAGPVPAEKQAEDREIVQAVQAVNAAELFGDNRELSFLMDRQTQRPVIRLMDRKTKAVIRQIPPEYVLRMAAEANQSR